MPVDFPANSLLGARSVWEEAEQAARKSLTLLPNKAPALNNLGIAAE